MRMVFSLVPRPLRVGGEGLGTTLGELGNATSMISHVDCRDMTLLRTYHPSF